VRERDPFEEALAAARAASASWTKRLAGATETTGLANSWLGTAATMASFDPSRIPRSRSRIIASAPDWAKGLCRQITAGPQQGQVVLDLALRRTVLRELGSAGAILRAAKASNGADAVNSVLVELLSKRLPPLEELERPKLAALAVVQRWLDGIIEGIPSAEAIAVRITEADLTAPLRKLINYGFVGRETELASLADYVGVLPELSLSGQFRRFIRRVARSIFTDPPMMIYGPGGVGKSTLVAKFILDHLYGPTSARAPFVYLDFDRPSLRHKDPAPLVSETLRQLAIQLPDMKAAAAEIATSLYQGARQYDVAEGLKSTRDLDWDVERAAEEIGRHVPSRAPLVLVLDTFEEVQFFGSDVVHGYLRVLDRLQSGLPRLRLVISGRAPVDQRVLRTTDIHLSGLDPDSGAAFLRQYLSKHSKGRVQDTSSLYKAGERLALSISRLAGGSPLALALAAENLIRAADDQAFDDDPEAVVRFIHQVRSDRLQENLYGRILDHLHSGDLRSIAYPGLVLRRIDPEVILKILAKPCALQIAQLSDAEALFGSLREELSLVEPEESGPGVRHRGDVRQLMLEEIEASDYARARAIDRRAAGYYRLLSDRTANPRDRAEELYHMMRLGYGPSSLDKRWIPGVERFLGAALDEVPAIQRIWLSRKLKVGIELAELEGSEQAVWEKTVERRVQQLLSIGDARRARDELLTRPPKTWLPGSTLLTLAAETFAALRDTRRALKFAELARRSALQFERHDEAVNAAVLEATILESVGRTDEGINQLRAVNNLRGRVGKQTELRLLVTEARLLAELNDVGDRARSVRASALMRSSKDKITLAASPRFSRSHARTPARPALCPPNA
jgi:hypothetical protein